MNSSTTLMMYVLLTLKKSIHRFIGSIIHRGMTCSRCCVVVGQWDRLTAGPRDLRNCSLTCSWCCTPWRVVEVVCCSGDLRNTATIILQLLLNILFCILIWYTSKYNKEFRLFLLEWRTCSKQPILLHRWLHYPI